jgi:hypothetical protein
VRFAVFSTVYRFFVVTGFGLRRCDFARFLTVLFAGLGMGSANRRLLILLV